MKYVGIDVHKKMCQAAVLDDDGELLDQIRFLNKKEDIKDFAFKLLTFRDDVKAVVESTGNLWIQIHDILEKYGIEVSLSNPYKTRLIAEAKNKTDKVDAKILARLLRADICELGTPGCAYVEIVLNNFQGTSWGDYGLDVVMTITDGA